MEQVTMFVAISGTQSKVVVIKEFRRITGASLKDAKEAVEAAMDGGHTCLLAEQAIEEFEKVGFRVMREEILSPRSLLQKAAQIEFDRDNFEVVSVLTAVLNKYYS